jgi:hypothetical protein
VKFALAADPYRPPNVAGVIYIGNSGEQWEATCFNTQGVSADAEDRTIPLSIDKHTIVPLWIGVQVPVTARRGDIASGDVSVTAGATWRATLPVRITVNGTALIAEHGDLEVWRMSRIRWLNSRRFQDELAHGFAPVRVQLQVHTLCHNLPCFYTSTSDCNQSTD